MRCDAEQRVKQFTAVSGESESSVLICIFERPLPLCWPVYIYSHFFTNLKLQADGLVYRVTEVLQTQGGEEYPKSIKQKEV